MLYTLETPDCSSYNFIEKRKEGKMISVKTKDAVGSHSYIQYTIQP